MQVLRLGRRVAEFEDSGIASMTLVGAMTGALEWRRHEHRSSSEPTAARRCPPPARRRLSRPPSWRQPARAGALLRRRAGARLAGSIPVPDGCLVARSSWSSRSRPAPDTFPTTANARNIFNDASMLLVMAVGMTFVMVAAGLDLSIGSVLVFSGVCAAKVMGCDRHRQGYWTVLVGLIAALLAGLAWGLFNGFCITGCGSQR